MRLGYIVALLMIVLMVGCATTQPAAPPAAPATPPAAPATPPAAPETPPAAPAEDAEPVVDADIQILNRAFDPDELTVSSGSTVTWINMDESAVHSLSIVGQGVICSRKQSGETCEYTFGEAGTYEIMDLINKFRGTIIVTGGAEAGVPEE